MGRSGFSGIWHVQYTVTVSGPNFCRQGPRWVKGASAGTGAPVAAAGAAANIYGCTAGMAPQPLYAWLLALLRTEKWKRL